MEKAAQQRVMLFAQFAQAADDPMHRHTRQRQRMRGEHHRRFERLGHHLGHARFKEFFGILLLARARDDRQVGPQFAHALDQLERRLDVGEGHHQHAGARDARRQQVLAPRAVAPGDRLAGGGGLAHALGIEVERHEADLFGFQEARQMLAGLAVAAQQGVLLGRHGAGGDLRQLHRAHQPFRSDEAQHNAIRKVHDQRREDHRQYHSRQHRLDQHGIDEGRIRGAHHQHETELAGRAQPQAGPQRGARAAAQEARQCRRDQQLDGQQQEHKHRQPRGIVPERHRIEQHAGRDKEQPQQHVAEGLDVLLDLVTVFGFRDQHAGDEGAQRRGQAGNLRQRGEAERHQQHVEHEQLARLAARHQAEPGMHQALADEEHQRQQHRGLQQRPTDLAGQRLDRLRQGGNQDEQGHDGEILEQQDAHHLAAVRGVEFAPVGQQLRQDRGGRHRERTAERHAGLP